MGNSYFSHNSKCLIKNNNNQSGDSINEKIPSQYNQTDHPINKKIMLYHFTSHKSIDKGKVKIEDLKTFRTTQMNRKDQVPNTESLKHISVPPMIYNSTHFKTLREEEDKYLKLFDEENDNKQFFQMKNKKHGTVREDLKNQNVSIEMHYSFVDKVYKELPGESKKAASLKDNKTYEIQIIPKSKIERPIEFVTEISEFKKIKHENIIQIIDLLFDQDNYYLIKEYCDCYDLLGVIINSPNYSQQDIYHIFFQIISALSAICKYKKYHGEISFSCIFFEKNNTSSNIKIDNFVVPKYYKADNSGFSTSPAQMFYSPEKMKNHINTEKVDVWGCGILLYYLCSGVQPFTGTSEEDYERRLEYGIVKFPKSIWGKISADVIALIKLMLEYVPEKRIYFENILDHNWMKSSSEKEKSSLFLQQTITNLRHLKSQLQFQSNILKFIAQKLISKEEEKTMRAKFKEFDENGDGSLSKNELIKGFTDIFKDKEKAILEVNKILHSRGETGKDSINYNEFILTQIDLKSKDLDKNLRNAFETFDINQNGSIPLDEMVKVLGGNASNFFLKNQIKKGLNFESNEIDFEKFKVIIFTLLSKT